ncbi:hypothetical protein [Candidatus Neomicrothrix sp.]|uniref:hypothetical protein n=1 Tax=Candidatus Neomicrothrix sp. TaxID=2719034 RepID=UPI0025C14867|nr:hypothetical protein [Candidatus Microthrix sp.]
MISPSASCFTCASVGAAFWISVSDNTIVLYGVATASMLSLATSVFSISWKILRFLGERNSSSVVPSSMRIAPSIAWPPKRSWYSTLSL